MDSSKGLKQKFIKNKIMLNNMLLDINKGKNKNLGIKSLKSNISNAKQSKFENNFPFNNIINRNEFNNINVMSNTNRNKINRKHTNNINDIISKLKPPDERLIYCIKMLGLVKYYSNFARNNLNFEEFLALTNDDMTKMKIPKNIQKLIQKFIMDYFNFGNLYSLDEIRNFFSRKKSRNIYNNEKIIQSSHSYDLCNKRMNNTKQKNILTNNYISRQDKNNKNNTKFKNNSQSNNKLYNNNIILYKKKFSYPNQNINSENINYKIRDEIDNNKEYNLNNIPKNQKNKYINNINYLNNGRNYLDINNPSNTSINTLTFQNRNKNRNYINKNEFNYENYYLTQSSFRNTKNNKNKITRYRSTNPSQNGSILNLKSSFKNFYSRRFEQNNLIRDVSNNDFNNMIESKIRNKSDCNINNRPILSEGNRRMIMNNLNNYFIYNNYRTDDYLKNDKKKVKTNYNKNSIINNNFKNKKYATNNIIDNNTDYLNIDMNGNNNNFNIKKYIQSNTNLTFSDCNKNNSNVLNSLTNNTLFIQNLKNNNTQINQFRTKKNKKTNLSNNKQNNLESKINRQIMIRNDKINDIINNCNYIANNNNISFNPNMNNLYLDYVNNKNIKRTSRNYLPIKAFTEVDMNNNNNINMIYSPINTYIRNNRLKKSRNNYINYMRNISNEKYYRQYNNSPSNMENYREKKTNNKSMLELLKSEINELYNKMQINNISDIGDNNNNFQ